MNKDRLEVLLKDIRTKLDLILEGQDVLRKEIREFGQELGEKIACLDSKVEALVKKLEN